MTSQQRGKTWHTRHHQYPQCIRNSEQTSIVPLNSCKISYTTLSNKKHSRSTWIQLRTEVILCSIATLSSEATETVFESCRCHVILEHIVRLWSTLHMQKYPHEYTTFSSLFLDPPLAPSKNRIFTYQVPPPLPSTIPQYFISTQVNPSSQCSILLRMCESRYKNEVFTQDADIVLEGKMLT